MGTWGPKLYQDDIAQDVRDEFKDLLKRGKTTEEITKQLIDQYAFEISDTDDAPIFWFALADTQWELGKLLPQVKEQAIDWINKGTDQQKWLFENPKNAQVRDQILGELREKLNSPMPPEKNLTPYKLYKCEWKIGDVFAYDFSSEYAKETHLLGKYICFIKVEDTIWHPGHIVPNVCVYNYIFDDKPDIDLVISKKLLPQFYKKQAYINHSELKKPYLLTLLNTSKKVIPKNLVYIGNVINFDKIDNEDKNPYRVSWKEFEKYIIDQYLEWKI